MWASRLGWRKRRWSFALKPCAVRPIRSTSPASIVSWAQIGASLAWLEQHTPDNGFVAGEDISHADIASVTAMTFISNKNPEHLGGSADRGDESYRKLLRHAQSCEQMAEFKAAPFTDD